MKFQIKHFISAFLAIALMAGWVTPAYAATVVSVAPSSIINDVDRTITVTGTGFDAPGVIFVVVLGGVQLVTLVTDSQTLTARHATSRD